MLREEDNQQTVIAVSDGPPLESDDRYAAHLLATILGDHTGSRLYWELIDPGLADGAEVSYQDYTGAGVFFTFLSCEPDAAQENLGRIADVYQRVLAEGITAEELTQAQNKVHRAVVLRSERPMGRLMPLGFHWAYRREYIPVERGARRLRPGHARRPPARPRALAAGADDGRLGRPHDRPASPGLSSTSAVLIHSFRGRFLAAPRLTQPAPRPPARRPGTASGGFQRPRFDHGSQKPPPATTGDAPR